MEEKGIRINKYLSESGICSRREADRRIEEGCVTIDGITAEMGSMVFPGQTVLVNGIPARIEEERILIAFNKPRGIVCTAEKREKDNVIDYINYPKRIYPVGRLDKDSEGLLLLTNQGEIVNKMMRSGNMHEKEYIVKVTRPISDTLIKGLAGGVPLTELGVTTRKCFVEQLTKYKFRIILTQGYNRQIRRMCEYFGYRVDTLQRIRVMNIELGDLPLGQYRDVTEEEFRQLMRLIRDSSNQPVAAPSGRRPRNERMKKDGEDRPQRKFIKDEQEYREVRRRREEEGRNDGSAGETASTSERRYSSRKPEEGRKYSEGPKPAENRKYSEGPKPAENRKFSDGKKPAGSEKTTGKKSTAFTAAGTMTAFEKRQQEKAARRAQKEENKSE